MSPYRNYLKIGYKPDFEKEVIATYSLSTKEDFLEVAGGIAAESSIGTWTDVRTQEKDSWERLHARVFEADKTSGLLKIAYPLELFEPGNIPQLLSSVAGNIFGLKEIKRLRLLDLELPQSYVKSFPGPAFGPEGIREKTGVFDRPLIGSIIKPKLGLGTKGHVKVVMEVFEGGADFVKDDENLTSQEFNKFEERVDGIMDNLRGEPKIYAFNVTAPVEIMLKRAEYVKEKGGNCVMIDFLTAGFAGLQELRNKNYGLIIHGHRAMHAVFDKIPDHGISMLVLAKLARLAGIDSLHTGTVVGKMEGGESEVTKINEFLLSSWKNLKKVLPVASGGLHPALVPDLIKILGTDVLLNFGGGIHGHPRGSLAGVKAVCQAVEATTKGLVLSSFAQNHEELRVALETWKEKP
jgi:ribulose-bisphosphate carboxylase large chain